MSRRLKRLEAVSKVGLFYTKRRGQSLAQLVLAWVLRDPRVTSALIGASSARQVEENVVALNDLTFSREELAETDRYAVEGGVNLWEKPSHEELV